jgi:ankyrin repeat protein
VDEQGNGPLHYLMSVFKKNNLEAVKIGQLLMDTCANPNLMNKHGVTPLQLAVKRTVV